MKRANSAQGRAGPLALGLVVALSGCLWPGGDGEAKPADGWLLDDVARCDFAYPDGSPMTCTGQATPHVPETTGPPLGWVCLGTTGDRHRGYSIHQNLTGDGWGIEYYVDPFQVPVSGVLRLTSGGRVTLHNWSEAGPIGFVRFPAAPTEATEMFLKTYGLSLATNTTTLKDARVELRWSLYDGDLWGLYRIASNGRDYFVNASVLIYGSYAPVSFEIEGQDFDLAVDYEKGFNAAGDYPSLTWTDPECTRRPLGLGLRGLLPGAVTIGQGGPPP